jgi:hypothetical protein
MKRTHSIRAAGHEALQLGPAVLWRDIRLNRWGTNMARKPTIPMTPEEVPRQRLHLVAELPARPQGFSAKCDFVDPMPDNKRPGGSPRNTLYIGSVEWAGSPMHTRFDSYYLNPRGAYWLLWIHWQDDNDWNLSWKWTLYAYGEKRGIDERTAATYLLMDAWAAERESANLDHYFLVDETGLLSMADISEIARQVWVDES